MSKQLLLGAAGGLLLLSGGLVGVYFVSSGDAQAAATVPEPAPPPAAEPRAQLDDRVELHLNGHAVTRTWAELGAVPAEGRVPIHIDDARAVAALVALKPALDTPPRNAKMDLEKRELVPEQPGLGIDVYGALAVLRAGLIQGAGTIELPSVAVPADVTREDLGNIDISHVMGRFVTKFAVVEKSRNYNLKLAASKLDGHVIMPGEDFSFNDVVGARTEKEGYKIAGVITEGEMVDGLAGGTCQISSTLHGASFFAGLEVVKALPHSRPSTYVQMGLDATVVYPHIDVKLRNPYDFPVVIHYRVARGETVVEILGKERPYDKIVFEREVIEEQPFDTVTREDDTLPVGSMVIEQEGFPGYKLKRYRRYYRDGKLVKTDTWNLRYKPVTEFARIGINPDPNLPPPKEKKGHGPTPPKDLVFKWEDPYLSQDG